jgi:MFS family permease
VIVARARGTLDRDFLKLWVGQSVSLVGSEVTGLAMPLLAAIVLGASAGEMGVLRAVQFAPELVALPIGVLADRMHRRPLLIGADLGRGLLLASLPLAALLGVLAMPQLYVVAVLSGALTVLFSVAYMAYLPVLVETRRLLEANSRLEVSRSAAHAGGPALAGLLIQVFSAPAALLFDAASFVVSALSLLLIHKPEPPPRHVPGSRPRIWPEIKAGLHAIAEQPVLRATTLSGATWNFFSGGMGDALFVLFYSRELQLSAAQIAALFTVSGVSGVVGAVNATRITRRFGLGPSVIVAFTATSAGTLAIPFIHGSTEQVLGLLGGLMIVFGLGMSMVFVVMGSLRQAFSPPELIGRVGASTRFLLVVLVPVGALLGGALGDAIGLRGALVVAGVGVLATPVWLVLSPIRSLRSLDQAS